MTWVPRQLFVLALACLMAATVARAQEKPHPQAKLDTAIAEAIRLLEAKEHATFLKNFVAPDDFKKITSQVPLEQFAERFGERKAGELLKVLQSIRNQKPMLNETETTATFAVDESVRVGNRDKIQFTKVEGLWYILN